MAALVWVLSGALLWAGQDRLLFAGAAPPIGEPFAPGVVVESVEVPVSPGVRLHGWLSRPEGTPATQRLPLALYFGGNAEEVSATVAWAAKLGGWAILAVDYRGYGGNPGEPSEAALLADALTIHDWAAQRTDVDAARIAVIGRSLGSGVAVHVAAQRPVRASILLTPYDSIAAVARRRFPHLPTDLLLRSRFDSVTRARQVAAPTLIVIADRDQVIPPAHAEALAAAWHGPHEVVRSPASNHNDILGDPAVWAAMRRWLAAFR